MHSNGGLGKVANHSAIGWAESIKWVSKPGDSPRKSEG